MSSSNNSHTSSNWPGFRKIWGIVAVILFLLLLLLWALGYGPGGSKCEVPPTVVEKEKLVDNPEHLTRIAALEEENGTIAGLNAKIAELEALPAKEVVKEVVKEIESPELLEKVNLLETENSMLENEVSQLEKDNGLIAGLKSKIGLLEKVEPLTPQLKARLTNLEKENSLIAGLRAKITSLEGMSKSAQGSKPSKEMSMRLAKLEKDNALIPGLKAKITALEGINPITINRKNPELEKKLSALQQENSLIAGLKAKISAMESAGPVTFDNPKLLTKINFLEIENQLIPGLRTKVKELESAKAKVAAMQLKASNVPDTAKLYFRINSASRPANAVNTLSGISDYLKNNENSKAMISGFHDATGNLELNQILSLKRADTVVNVLNKAGIPRDRLLVTKPAQTVGSGTRREARRVEVNIAR